MPSYNYYCSSCDLVFSDLVSMSDYNKPQECKKCGTPSDRTARGQAINAHGLGLTDGRSESDKARTEHRWMEDEIENTKKALKYDKGVSPYAEYKVNHEVAVEKGLARKLTSEEKAEKIKDREKAVKKLAEGMSDNDIHYTKLANDNRTH